MTHLPAGASCMQMQIVWLTAQHGLLTSVHPLVADHPGRQKLESSRPCLQTPHGVSHIDCTHC